MNVIKTIKLDFAYRQGKRRIAKQLDEEQKKHVAHGYKKELIEKRVHELVRTDERMYTWGNYLRVEKHLRVLSFEKLGNVVARLKNLLYLVLLASIVLEVSVSVGDHFIGVIGGVSAVIIGCCHVIERHYKQKHEFRSKLLSCFEGTVL